MIEAPKGADNACTTDCNRTKQPIRYSHQQRLLSHNKHFISSFCCCHFWSICCGNPTNLPAKYEK